MGRAPSGSTKPNGVDFWWDEFPSNTGDCWHDNVGTDGTNASWTGDPQRFATPGMSVPGFLPEDCSAPTNVGTGDPVKEAVLLNCANVAIGDPSCEWYTKPPKPGTAAAARYRRAQANRAQRILAEQQLSAPACDLVGTTISCTVYGSRP
jgi:hypothetical protein